MRPLRALVGAFSLRLGLGAGLLAAGVVAVALASAFGPVSAGAAVAATAMLAALAVAGVLADRLPAAKRFGADALLGSGVALVLLVLAWLVPHAGVAFGAFQLLSVAVLAYAGLYLPGPWVAALAALAIVANGTSLFMLVEAGTHPSVSALWAQSAAFALALAWIATASIAVRRLRSRLEEARGDLHDLRIEAAERAGRDPLTGLAHERHLLDALEREIARAERIGKPLSVARVDLDWIAQLNDRHGRSTGDIALKRFAAAAAEALRDVDVIGRYAGEEFLVVMPDTALEGAVIAANRILASVRREPAPEVDGRRHLSCSLGVAEHRAGENTRLVIDRAEAALNFAKAAGRARVVALDADGRPVVIGGA